MKIPRCKPLQGIRVLDLTRLLPGPMCTLHLADMGADVIKIEDTGDGDYARKIGTRSADNSLFFLALNRNKRGVRLDLKQPRGREVFLKLTERADVIVESFRPGVMDKLGIAYSLEGLAQVSAAKESWERAAVLWGAANQLRGTLHVPLESSRENIYTSLIPMTRARIGDEVFDMAWKKGKSMTLNEAIAYALTLPGH